jgi:hypothetical protein
LVDAEMIGNPGEVRELVRAGRRRSHRLDQALYLVRLQLRLGLQRPVLVFSLGKVGTTSLARAIELATGRETIHCHRVSAAGTRRNRSNAIIENRRPFPHTWRGEYVRWRLALPAFRTGDWEIVCGVREPVGHLVSTVFQELGTVRRGDFESIDLTTIRDQVTERFTAGRTGLHWFDDELRAVTGIDVYATPFNRDQGWQIYESERFRVLVLRYEDLATSGPAAMLSMFGLEAEPVVPNANVGAEKSYGAVYRRFMDEVTLPQWLLDASYASRQARHFYSPIELERFRARWERR